MKNRLLVLTLLVAGCTTLQVDPKPPAPVSALPSVKTVVPYRSFLPPRFVLRDSELQSFVLMARRPLTQADKDLYESVCRHWQADLEEKSAFANTNAQMTPLYWPTRSRQPQTCKDLYDYDYARAYFILAEIGNDALASHGPILALQHGDTWLWLDVSRFSPQDVERAFALWKQQVAATDPLNVTAFNIAKFKEYFRTLIVVYGEAIFKVVEKS